MSLLTIDHLDIDLGAVDPRTAEAVRRELPAALRRRLGSASVQRGDIGALRLSPLNLPPGLPPRALADAIAARLGVWLQSEPAPGP